ncbi:hypothetical protein [Thalassomonas haliotis]|nr:hypothetical protein [Thalassomonas haliotis]
MLRYRTAAGPVSKIHAAKEKTASQASARAAENAAEEDHARLISL